jgi:TolB protein
MLFFRGEKDETGDLFVVDADGTGLRQLNGRRTTVRNVFGVSPADWSPDGRAIVFASGTGDGRSSVFVVGADGRHRRRITPWGPWTTSAHWSPDGQRIVYDKINNPSGSHDLFLVHADGTEPTAITSTTDGYGSCCAVWASDGSKLLFLRASAGGQYDLWVVDPDGTGLAQLTDTAGTEEGYSWAPTVQAES